MRPSAAPCNFDPPAPQQRRLRAWAAVLLLSAVVLVQQLGLVHRAVHLHAGGHPAHDEEVACSQAECEHEAGHDHSWLAALFADHDAEGCALFDGATCSGTPSAATALPQPQVAAAVLAAPGLSPASAFRAARYARGPPPLHPGS